MIINIKKLHPEAVIPKYAKEGDAGMDLTATSISYDEDTGIITYGTGLAFEIPDGHVGLIYPRSSIYKYPLVLCNHVGVVDSKYRGEVMFKFRRANGVVLYEPEFEEILAPFIYKIGDRIGQIVIMPYPIITFNEVQELSNTERGSGGFGSTDVG